VWRALTSAAAPAPATAILETATIRLSPQDTFLNLDASNYSADTRLLTHTWPDNQVKNAIVMKFDLSALPAGAAIQDARLNLALVQSDLSLDLTYTVTAHKVLGSNPVIAATTGYTADGVNPWTANACCFNNIPMAQANLSPAYATRAIDKLPGFKTWDVTTMVEEWMQTPAENFGLLLNADMTRPRDRYRQFASMEHAISTLRPFLEVTYSASDTTPPSVAVTAPQSGESLSGTTTLVATASDNVGVAGVQFQIDGAPAGPERLSPPYRLDWDSTTVSDGTHTITASARDAAGNAATSAGVSVTVANGVVILQPQDTFLNLDTINYSANPILATYTWPDFKAANAILMRFNLADIPAGAIVQDATLRLNLVDNDASPDATYAIAVHKIVVKNPAIAAATGYTADGTTVWTPNACCYNGVPLAQADISAAYDTQPIDKTAGYKGWTITGLVQEWLLNPATNLGLLLNSDTSKAADRYRFFASMEDPNPGKRPFLRVAYSVSSDSTSPAVAITSPPQSAIVQGVTTLVASATDNVGVAGVQFKVDGMAIGPEDTTAPYERAWDTAGVSEGQHTITATARDIAGNLATSAGVTVTKDGAGPAISAVSASGVTESGATITWTTSEPGDSRVEYGVTPAYGSSTPVDPSLVTSHSVTLGGLSDYRQYHVRVHSRDAAGNPAVSGDVTFSTLDGTAPSASITSPVSGSTVAGTVTVAASASDNAGVAGVQFYIDGAPIEGEDTTAPYQLTWDTGPVSEGHHTIAARARDAAGHDTISAGVTVTIDRTAPSVSITSPANGATVAGSVTIAASASDNAAVAGVQFTLNGANLGNEDTTAPYSVSWSTTATPDGSYSLTAVARDAAGHSRTSASVTVTVANAPPPPPPPPPSGGIAALYPGDVNIESHPDVVFVERFEDASLNSVFSRWTDVLNGSGMALVSDVPPGSPGSRALNIPWEGGGLNNGGHLYKLLSPGVSDTLYVRYYIKHPASGRYQHAGIWMGGNNPALSWPNPQAGVKPTGTDRFIASAEQDTASHYFDHYDYWMNMRLSSDGNYWGNRLLHDADVQANAGQWMCVEHMVKLNNPVTASNGEHAIWLDGVKVSHLGQGFPNGTWSGGTFTQSPGGSPFEGFRWRSDENLELNWIWLQNYATLDPPGFRGDMKFDHVVLARSHVGCLAGGEPPPPPPPPPSGWPNEPTGMTVLSDWNMDQAPPTSGDVPISGSGGWKVIRNSVPGSPQGWVARVSDAGAPQSPSNVYDFVYPAGLIEGEAPATVYYDGLNADEVYVGFWWKPSSPFDYGPNGNKIAFIYNGGGASGGQQFLILYPDGRLHILPEYPGDYQWRRPNVNATVVTLGAWHRIEWYTNRVTGTLKWWLDGVLQGSYTNVVNPIRFDMFQFNPTWGGNIGARKAQTDHYWFDHAHLSKR
jgi:hypothetical protein